MAPVYIWDRSERFRCANVELKPNLNRERGRWTTKRTIPDSSDHQWIGHAISFPMDALVAFLDARPGLSQLNADYRQETWYAAHEGDLKTE